MTTPHYVAPVRTGPAKGSVLVLQEAFGVNGHIRDVCDRFAAAGWHAVAPHLYHRTGDPEIDYSNVEQTRAHALALTTEGLRVDLLAGLTALGPGAAVVGFCMGGSLALWAAVTLPGVSCAVSFYGGGVQAARFGGVAPLADLAPQLRVPWLGLYGELDLSIPPEDVAALRAAAQHSMAPTELVTYPDAGHGFHCDSRESFQPIAAADAWRRTLGFLELHAPAAPQ